jgi:hypothetical protein
MHNVAKYKPSEKKDQKKKDEFLLALSPALLVKVTPMFKGRNEKGSKQ